MALTQEKSCQQPLVATKPKPKVKLRDRARAVGIELDGSSSHTTNSTSTDYATTLAINITQPKPNLSSKAFDSFLDPYINWILCVFYYILIWWNVVITTWKATLQSLKESTPRHNLSDMSKTVTTTPVLDVHNVSDDSGTTCGDSSDPEWCNVDVVPADGQDPTLEDNDNSQYYTIDEGTIDDDEEDNYSDDVPNTMVLDSLAPCTTMSVHVRTTTTIQTQPSILSPIPQQ